MFWAQRTCRWTTKSKVAVVAWTLPPCGRARFSVFGVTVSVLHTHYEISVKIRRNPWGWRLWNYSPSCNSILTYFPSSCVSCTLSSSYASCNSITIHRVVICYTGFLPRCLHSSWVLIFIGPAIQNWFQLIPSPPKQTQTYVLIKIPNFYCKLSLSLAWCLAYIFWLIVRAVRWIMAKRVISMSVLMRMYFYI